MKKNRMNRSQVIWTGLLVIAVIAVAATWTMAQSDKPTVQSDPTQTAAAGNLSKALLEVSNMSCGGCVETITKSLASLPGIGDVMVDVAAGTAQVMFNPERLQDHQLIAGTITKAGYPAKITRIDAAEKVQKEAAQAAQRAETHIASVGRVEIPREDFDVELGHARKRYEKIYGQDVFDTERGRLLLTRVTSQIALRLIDEGIKLQEVARAGYSVSPETIDQALAAYLSDRETTFNRLQTDLEANDYPFAYFQTKFARRVRLQRYLEDKVLGDSVDEDARRQQYADWLANARLLANVTYYDKALEKLVKAAGGSSCGGGAGGCSGAK